MSAIITQPRSATDVVRDVVAERFPVYVDGWFYPAAVEESVVRIAVYAGQYKVQRRRSPELGWVPITVADVAEFDPVAFERWRTHWPLSVIAQR